MRIYLYYSELLENILSQNAVNVLSSNVGANPGFYRISFDVSPNGRRFIINTAPRKKQLPSRW